MTDTNIELSFTYRNHLNQISECSLSFNSIHDFKNYLRWEPDKAMLIGYGKVDPDRVKITRTSDLTVGIVDNGLWFGFKTARGFADFLNWNHAVATKLQAG